MAKNHFARAEIDSQCVLKKGIFVEKWTQNFDLGTGNAIFGSPKVAKNCFGATNAWVCSAFGNVYRKGSIQFSSKVVHRIS